MKNITIPLSISEIQHNLLAIDYSEELSLVVNLNDLENRKSDILLESYLALWVVTLWSKLKKNKLSISITGHSDFEQLQRLGNSLPGVFLSILSTTGRIEGIKRSDAAKFREKYFLNQQTWPSLVKNDSTFLICQDSFSRGFPKQLYPSTSYLDVIDSTAFEKIINKLIDSVSPNDTIQTELSEKTVSISLILHELFKNTNDHATTSYDNKIIGDSLRGIYCRFYTEESLNGQIKKTDENKWNQYERFAHAFIKKNEAPLTVKQQRINNILKRSPKFFGILEFSVIDSGSGLAAKWAKSDVSNLSPIEQLNNVLDCFKKGNSSVPSGERGYGLWKVLNNVQKLNGMISVRTNGVHAFRQFIVSQGVGTITNSLGQNVPIEQFHDWNKGYSTQPSEYPQVSGSLISILIPLVSE